MMPQFQEKLKRAELLALPLNANATGISIAVHRNHSFELVASVLNAFLDISALRADFWYSAYDNSFAFYQMPTKADLHIIWADAAHYSGEDFAQFCIERAKALHQAGAGKILLACTGLQNGADSINTGALPPGTMFLDVDQTVAELGGSAYAEHLTAHTGTRLSNEATLLVARQLGCRYIPALLRPALKALVLDLDNTLYAGVLGEDGPSGVKPYIKLQEHIKALAKQGFMLAIASKNEQADVQELFATRPDFALHWQDFAATGINWQPKAQNIRAIAKQMNIGLDAMLFIDDNPGETLHVANEIPELHIIKATSPEYTLNALRYYPGLMKNNITAEDAIRTGDIKANAQREALQQSLSPAEYLAQLEIEVDFAVNHPAHMARVTELLNKTNQFILSFKRPDAAMVQEYFADTNKCYVTAAMRDKLSDSGIIAVMLAEKTNVSANALLITELAVSCRALGRGIESGIIEYMIELAKFTLAPVAQTQVIWRSGPRNNPARTWLSAYSGVNLPESAYVTLPTQNVMQLKDAPLPGKCLEGVKINLISSW